SPGQAKLLAKRAAEMDAYRKLAEYLLGLEIQSSTTVKDFTTESDKIAGAVDALVKNVQFTEVRYFDDGTVEVQAQISLRQVITDLKKICDEVYKGGQWKKESFDQIEKNSSQEIIIVIGSGAARATSNVPDPQTTAVVTNHQAQSAHLPAIFKNYSPNARLQAKRAAEMDAYRKLLEQIQGMKISASTYVRDFVTESDSIKSALVGCIKGARIHDIRYHEDGSVEVEASLTLEQVIKTVKKVCDEVYKGGKWEKHQFDEISRRTQHKAITVLGLGVIGNKAVTGNNKAALSAVTDMTLPE
ncbi:MAG: LPP20 family lipoprotein, partial [Phycisphaeraceae bacterium]|nr:LPP20 family lipoprotein [Phycisphaeraceae bacterium]